eukprot:1157129-Pelagomonas_calceolata.AAC.3
MKEKRNPWLRHCTSLPPREGEESRWGSKGLLAVPVEMTRACAFLRGNPTCLPGLPLTKALMKLRQVLLESGLYTCLKIHSWEAVLLKECWACSKRVGRAMICEAIKLSGGLGAQTVAIQSLKDCLFEIISKMTKAVCKAVQQCKTVAAEALGAWFLKDCLYDSVGQNNQGGMQSCAAVQGSGS